MHVITGLPRSGSTLLCNILNQNPHITASSTSPVCGLLAGLVQNWSNVIEVKSDLERDREGTEKKLRHTARAFCNAWHSNGKEKKVVFDKGRAWMHHLLMLRDVFPDSKVIVLIRDLRDVLSSIEKQHRKNPILDDTPNAQGKLEYSRADGFLKEDGIIGQPLRGIEDLIRRRLTACFIRFEDLVADPKAALSGIYKYLGVDPFEHQFKNVKNTATDPDGFYLMKFPHSGNGKVTSKTVGEWRDYVSPDVAQLTVNSFKWFYDKFGYDTDCGLAEDVADDED